jgi:threonine/homoserine/homoserine lactone efflux protein
MAIMATAMSQGRRQSLALAAGVVCGSLIWGVAAALGFSALMQIYSWAVVALKILGGFYLLYLSVRAARAALSQHPIRLSTRTAADSEWRAFATGLGMHVTNPKAIFVLNRPGN